MLRKPCRSNSSGICDCCRDCFGRATSPGPTRAPPELSASSGCVAMPGGGASPADIASAVAAAPEVSASSGFITALCFAMPGGVTASTISSEVHPQLARQCAVALVHAGLTLSRHCARRSQEAELRQQLLQILHRHGGRVVSSAPGQEDPSTSDSVAALCCEIPVGRASTNRHSNCCSGGVDRVSLSGPRRPIFTRRHCESDDNLWHLHQLFLPSAAQVTRRSAPRGPWARP